MLTNRQNADRDAYNAAFLELEFSWRWDEPTYQELLLIPEEERRIGSYLEHHQPHLLKAYDIRFLSGLILERKRRWLSEHLVH